jgi:signal transduction histidine kinase
MGRALLSFATTALVTGVGCLWATVVAPPGDRAFVGASLGAAAVLLCVAVAVAAYRSEEVHDLRDRLAAMDASVARLADETLPAVMKRLRDGASPDTALTEVAQPVDSAQQRILWTVTHELGHGERMRVATMAACANAAGRVQALATSMLAELREMEERHSEEVLGDLLRLDHSTAQAGRLADSIAVLAGARSGRRWTKPIVMESILRGAVGRIGAYRRVRLHSTLTVAVVGYAAEGVMHALAELMDNAAKFSPPSEQVHVYAEEVQAGVVITVEDGGLAMSDAALRRAERAVSPEPLDLATLSGTRLGLAVVGCLARKHGLTVSFRPSSRGGTGVVIMIPRQLITEPRDDAIAAAALADRTVPIGPSASAVPSSAGDAGPVDAAAARVRTPGKAQGEMQEEAEATATQHGLPKRRRGQTLAATLRSAPPTASPSSQSTSSTSTASTGPSASSPSGTTARPPRAPADAGSRFSAFRQASRASQADRGDDDQDGGVEPPGPVDDVVSPRAAGTGDTAGTAGTAGTADATDATDAGDAGDESG